MPTYEYRCSVCGHKFEVILKGSGFYQTDYRVGNRASDDGEKSPGKGTGPERSGKKGASDDT